MKKFIALVMVAFAVLGLAGCQDDSQSPNQVQQYQKAGGGDN